MTEDQQKRINDLSSLLRTQKEKLKVMQDTQKNFKEMNTSNRPKIDVGYGSGTSTRIEPYFNVYQNPDSEYARTHQNATIELFLSVAVPRQEQLVNYLQETYDKL